MKVIATFENHFDKKDIVDVEMIEKGIHTKKSVSVDVYISMLAQSYAEQVKFDKENHNKNIFIKKEYLQINETGHQKELIFKIEEHALMLVSQNKPVAWYLPTLICKCSEEGSLSFWCSKVNDIDMSTEIYRLQLPHHYDNGSVCYGTFVKKSVEIDEMLEYAVSYLQTSANHTLNGTNLVEIDPGVYLYDIMDKDLVGTYESMFMKGV